VKFQKQMRDIALRHTRQVTAKQIREQMLDKRTRQNILQLHRWDILKEKKAEAVDEGL